MKSSLGVIKKTDDLRSVWPNAAHDFSKWQIYPVGGVFYITGVKTTDRNEKNRNQDNFVS